jgi:hypothetical protein
VEPLFDYQNTGGSVVTAGYIVRDGALAGLGGRGLFADFGGGAIQSLQLNPADPAPALTGASVPTLASFGEDALGRLYAASLGPPGNVFRLVPGPAPGELAAQPIPGAWDQPLAIAGVPGDANQLLVGQRAGLVRRVAGGQAQSAPFLDLSGSVTTDGERGLLSVAAAPDYASSGRFYVYYTDLVGNIQVDEFTRSATNPAVADPASRRPLLALDHSNVSNHNGGQLQFGPDDCLWITTGDGGGQNDQFDNAQNVATHKGKILRIDPDPPGRGGPVCHLPPLPPTVVPTAAGPAPDTVAPRLRTRIKRRQRVLRLRGAVAHDRCDEPCAIATGGTLKLGRKRFRMRRATRAAQVRRSSRMKVRLTRRGTRALRRALRRKRHASVRIGLRATDRAGNRSRLVRATVRVRR